jgi:hypothetical protein
VRAAIALVSFNNAQRRYEGDRVSHVIRRTNCSPVTFGRMRQVPWQMIAERRRRLCRVVLVRSI